MSEIMMKMQVFLSVMVKSVKNHFSCRVDIGEVIRERGQLEVVKLSGCTAGPSHPLVLEGRRSS